MKIKIYLKIFIFFFTLFFSNISLAFDTSVAEKYNDIFTNNILTFFPNLILFFEIFKSDFVTCILFRFLFEPIL